MIYLKDFNLEKDAVMGRNLFDVLPFTGSEKENIKEDIERFLSERTIDPKELKVGSRTFGYRLFYLVKGSHETEKAGLIMRDRTMEVKLQQQLVQSEKLAGIGTMAMGIAHEINNPLFGIMGMAEAILDENDPNLVKEYARDIVKYSKVASGIVRGLTVYSRSTEAGDLKLVDIHDNLNEAIKIVRHSAHFDGIETVKHYMADRTIMVNSGELQQVFVNIIHNAAQAMDGKGRLQISTMTAGDSVVIKIKDNGPGIPPEHLGRIFDPFFTTKDPDKGTGLGLNIVYRIVQKYNGTIGVDSEVGKGATFTMTFPAGE
jgi:signal transduction histidine kinase